MPFIGIDKESGERVNILDYANPRAELKPRSLVCRHCGEDFYIRGSVAHAVRAHFVHKSTVECDASKRAHPETPEHLFFKEHLYRHLVAEIEEYTNCTTAIEYGIPEAGLHGRTADVAILFPNGWIVCHEIQLAPISLEDLNQRTEDYRDAGADVIWWFGGQADTETNRNWAEETIGASYSLDFDYIPESYRVGNSQGQ